MKWTFQNRSKTDSEANQTLFVVISIVAGIWTYNHLEQFRQIENQIIATLTDITSLIKIFLVLLAIFIPFYITYRIIKSIRLKRLRQSEEEVSAYWVGERVKDLFKKYEYNHELTLEQFIEALENKLKELNYINGISEVRERIKREIKRSKNRLIEQQHERAIYWLNSRIEEKEKRIRVLEQEEEFILERMENDKKKILEKIKSESNRVFEVNKLSKKQKEALSSNRYKQVNEFSIIEKKRIPVLIKPFGNHSTTHEFLVWDLKRLLEKMKEIRKIKEHLTKDADITFIYKNRTYALEVETGNILGKPDQLKIKLNQLNKRYPSRWMIIVSNRNLASKYRKFGLTSTRNRMCENLSKLLKIAHT